MAINKHNYEAFFLDYIEGNLSVETTADLLLFLEENPVLKKGLEEFELIQIDPSLESFNSKEELKKNIQKENVEDFIIGSIEKVNTPEDEYELKTFLADNPKSNLLFERYQKTILSTPTIIFSNKNKLKKKNRALVLYPFIGAAASILFFFMLNTNTTDQEYNPRALLLMDYSIPENGDFENIRKNISVVQKKKEVKKPIAIFSPKKETDTIAFLPPQINHLQIDTHTFEKIISTSEIVSSQNLINAKDSSLFSKNNSITSTLKTNDALSMNEWANRKVRNNLLKQKTNDSSKIKREEVFDALANGLNKVSKQEVAYNNNISENYVTQGFSVGNFEFSRTKRKKVKS